MVACWVLPMCPGYLQGTEKRGEWQELVQMQIAHFFLLLLLARAGPKTCKALAGDGRRHLAPKTEQE